MQEKATEVTGLSASACGGGATYGGVHTEQILLKYALIPGTGTVSGSIDGSYIPVGTTTTFPITSPKNSSPSLRYSFSAAHVGYLNWSAGAPGGGDSGTLTVAGDGKSGSFDLQLPFLGNDGNTIPKSAHRPVHIVGKFKC